MSKLKWKYQDEFKVLSRAIEALSHLFEPD